MLKFALEQANKLLPGESAINEVDVPSKKHHRVLRISESLFMMLLTSITTFLVPGSLPYMGEKQQDLVWMNVIYLVIPALGTATAAFFRPFSRSHRVFPWASIASQTILFSYLLICTIRHSRPYVYHAKWLIYLVLILFALLSGYNSTMVYLILRQEEIVETAFVEQAQRWAGFAYQVGGFIGIFTNLGLLHGKIYYHS